ncbi:MULTISPECIES: endonuclease/exonuclease/phosphatase family protein [unclassified Streptomyces]|uniref:endonuclease/exonuclease/phosphatase family protein n=1 Tax=unclassified Streptomyces TaxID=2593676 RepID=UPI000CD4FB5D|nr:MULTISPECIES: endonuclease/exonuclease/phosphatase family protein [unclassified Streptomyces]RPK49122.1 Endonuclease/Exonuclease/phosphatase family protein [Streptomyces sp. ADI93-02]
MGGDAVGGSALRIMSFNLQVDWEGAPHPWSARREAVIALLRHERPHLLGTQEGLYSQVGEAQEGLGPEYARIGEGREGGERGEHMAVLYDRNRLESLEHGHFWLSDTPHVPGSETWGGGCPRMVTWVRFRDLVTGGELFAANTHFDHESAYARARSAALLAERLDALASGVPRLITGDFNTPAGDPEVHAVLSAQAGLEDTWDNAERRGPSYGTFHGYGPLRPDGARIDWILASRGTRVHGTSVGLPAPDAVWPSDHLPVRAVVELSC